MALAGTSAVLAACATPDHVTCLPGAGEPMDLFTLYLGEAIPGRSDLTAAEWQSFLDGTVSTNLPMGYTIIDTSGAWRNPVSGKTAHEATKLLLVALPRSTDGVAAIRRVRAQYQTQFHQQLVGMTVEHVCGTF